MQALRVEVMFRSLHPFVAGRTRDGAVRETIQCRPSVLRLEVVRPIVILRLPMFVLIQGRGVRTSIPPLSARFGEHRASDCWAAAAVFVFGEVVQA